MLRGLGWLTALLIVVAACWALYGHISRGVVPGNGDVFTHNEPSGPKDIDNSPIKAESTPDSAPVSIPAAVVTPAPVAATPRLVPVQSPTSVTATPPLSDSNTPNPVNGMAFGGDGKYQWYRQGNLTWRIDTTEGTSCIDFATMKEWNNPVVYSHACGSSRRS